VGGLLGDRRRQVLHQIERQAELAQFGVDVADQRGAGGQPLGRRRDDHRIAALEGVDDLVGGCRPGVGGGRDGDHDTDRTGNFDEAEFRVFGDDADRSDTLEVAQQTEGLAVILLELVFDVAEAGVANRHFRQRQVASRFHDRPADGKHGVIDLRLVALFECALRGAGTGNQPGDDVFARRRPFLYCRGTCHVSPPNDADPSPASYLSENENFDFVF